MASTWQSTGQARQAQDVDAIPTLAWSARPDGSAEFLNRRWLDYTGLSAGEAADWGWTVAQRGRCNPARDRKSTRLNSSHQIISYAVFCLKQKKSKRRCSSRGLLSYVRRSGSAGRPCQSWFGEFDLDR